MPGVRRQHLRGRDDQLRGVLPLVPLLLCRGRPRGRLRPVRGEQENNNIINSNVTTNINRLILAFPVMYSLLIVTGLGLDTV